jgi:hypothetical protein
VRASGAGGVLALPLPGVGLMWHIKRISYGNAGGLEQFLRAGWEPFAVTIEPDSLREVVWLRRRSD